MGRTNPTGTASFKALGGFAAAFGAAAILFLLVNPSSPSSLNSSGAEEPKDADSRNSHPHASAKKHPATDAPLPADYGSLMKYIETNKAPRKVARAIAKIKETPGYKEKAIAEISEKTINATGQEKLKYIWTLGEIQDNTALETLSSLTETTETPVKIAAYASIARTGTPEAASILLDKYGAEEEFGKVQIASLILKMGRNDEVVLFLAACLENDKRETAAMKILKQMTGIDFSGDARKEMMMKLQSWLKSRGGPELKGRRS